MYVGDFPNIVNEYKPVGEVGVFYTNQMIVEGTEPVTLTLVSGSVEGLSFNSTTLVYSGTPLKSGLFQLIFKAENVLGSYQKTFNLLITEPSAVPPADITNDTLKNGVLGQSYSDFVLATGDDLEWAYFSGTLPTGLSLNNYTGEISGVPLGLGGTFNFAIICFNPGGFDIQSYEIFIATPPLIISRSLPDGTVGEIYLFQINAIGDAPISFSVVTPSGSETGLPLGLNLSSTGSFNGTINDVAGIYTFTVKAQNVYGIYTVSYSLTINDIITDYLNFVILKKVCDKLFIKNPLSGTVKEVYEIIGRS